MVLIMVLSFGVSWKLKSKFRKYSEIGLRSGLSGREVAEMMLSDNNITDVRVISTEGMLTDHYDPTNKTVNLSEGVYASRSAAAAAVAAHECGHAVQHARAYSMLKFRSAMVPALSVASRYMQWILIIGILMMQTTMIPLAIGVGASRLRELPELPGYLFWDESQFLLPLSADRAGMTVQVPLNAGRDLVELVVQTRDKDEWMHAAGWIYRRQA